MNTRYKAPLPKELFLLKADTAFLNHGSFGATPKPVFDKYQWWQREMERQPVEFLSSTRRFNGLMHEAREALAVYLHTHADNEGENQLAIFSICIQGSWHLSGRYAQLADMQIK